MSTLPQLFSDLRFTSAQLYFTDVEYNSIAMEFFGNTGPKTLTDRERAFLQAALFVAVDKSEKAGFIFSLYKDFMTAAPSHSLKTLAKKLARTTAKQLFKSYIDDDPKYSAVGKAGVQYSAFATQWRMRIGLDDPDELDNFLVA